MNKETLKSYNSRLNDNTISLNDILATINTLPEKNTQDKSVTITENGTQIVTPDEGYSGLNSVEITTNVGGGENLHALDEFYEAYKKFYERFDPSYNKTYDTTEEVTLYTPVANYEIYFIILRTNSTYQVMWTQNESPVGIMRKYSTVSSSYIFWPMKTSGLASQNIWYNGKQAVTSSGYNLVSYSGTNTGINYYLSPQYSTIEECIQAMKDPTTVYTYGKTQNNYVGWHTDRSCVALTNGIDLGTDMRFNKDGRQISSNEIIEVIPTE